jgi:hypothetical protein
MTRIDLLPSSPATTRADPASTATLSTTRDANRTTNGTTPIAGQLQCPSLRRHGFDHVVANMFFLPATIFAGVPDLDTFRN